MSAAAPGCPGNSASAATTARTAKKAQAAFTMQIKGLFDLLVGLLPDNKDVLRAEVAMNDLTALYPTKIIELWGDLIAKICGEQLLAKDLDYFMGLDVTATVARLQAEDIVPADLDTSYLEDFVESQVRKHIRLLSPPDQAKCMNVLAILTSLATAYHGAVHPAPVVAAAAESSSSAPSPPPAKEEEEEEEIGKKRKALQSPSAAVVVSKEAKRTTTNTEE